jgi:hypothetical protein
VGVRRHKGEVSASNTIYFLQSKDTLSFIVSGVHTILTFMIKTIRSTRVFLSFEVFWL